MSDDKKAHISEKIREIRKSRKMTQKQLADRVGVTPPSIVRVEKGLQAISIGTDKSLGERIAHALDVTMYELLGEESIFANAGVKILHEAGRVQSTPLIKKKKYEEVKILKKHNTPDYEYYALEVYNHGNLIPDESLIVCTKIKNDKLVAKQHYHICKQEADGYIHLIVRLDLTASGELVFVRLTDDVGATPIPYTTTSETYTIIGKTEKYIGDFL